MAESKLLNLQDAIKRYIPSGSSLVIGATLETMIPFAAGHEIIRQGKKNLTLIGPISDILFDQLIGAGCVSSVKAAWVGNVITGSGYNFRRGVENGSITVEDHSNLTITMALRAGAMGLPFMPTLTALGGDLYKTNTGIKEIDCPFTGRKLTAVASINPDVAVIHVQRSDEHGNAHAWGNFGIAREACLASEKIILTAEEIVETEFIKRDPNRVITPGFRVSAVVHAPWGAHPSPAPGFYNRDHEFFLEYREFSKNRESFRNWLETWVTPVRNSGDYRKILGAGRMDSLKIKNHMLSEGVDYGY